MLRLARVLLLLCLLAAPARAVTLSHQGYLLDGLDAPVDANVTLTFRLYGASDATSALWSEAVPVVVRAGYYSVVLGVGTPFPADAFDGSPRWLGVEVPGAGELTPRLTIGAAHRAEDSERVGGKTLAQLDATYAAKATLAAAGGTTNDPGNPVDFTRLKSVPAELLRTASAGGAGLLSAADHAAFSAKVASVAAAQGGGIAVGGTAASPTLSLDVKTTAPLSGAGTEASPLAIATASATADGALTSADWNTFNGKVSTITAGTGIAITGTAQNPVISATGGGGGATGTGLLRPPRYVSGFSGTSGPDLTWEGYTQCYGWLNNGTTPAPSYASVRTACGTGKNLLFAGNRAGSGTLIRHQVEMSGTFADVMPATQPTTSTYFDSFDVDGRYTFAHQNGYLLVGTRGNRWGDPGRLWEPAANGDSNASAGHVLSQEGNNANDQSTVTGDRYFIYLRDTVYSSCRAILLANPSAQSGPYQITYDGVTAVNTYCDMSDGGWTLALNQVNGSLLPDVQTDVNAANFGSTTTSWRVGKDAIKLARPTTAWKLTDQTNTVYFKPACVVDWSVNYLDQPAHSCTTGYTSATFATAVNGGWINVATRGIGINNSGQFCSIRAYNLVNVPVGAATSCTYTTNVTIQLWFK